MPTALSASRIRMAVRGSCLNAFIQPGQPGMQCCRCCRRTSASAGGPKASKHLGLDLRHLDRPFGRGVCEAGIRVAGEACYGLPLLRETTLVLAVLVWLCGPFAPTRPFAQGGDSGSHWRLGSESFGTSCPRELGFDQRPSVAGADRTTCLAQRSLLQAPPAEAVGFDDKGRHPVQAGPHGAGAHRPQAWQDIRQSQADVSAQQ